ncbi:MAG: hypothetical protein CMD31_09285 [Flavobacteriales bacterium]|nr:hypothetical protein [Flavobacteriales bacterium]
MNNKSLLPFRQKILLGLTIFVGLFIITSYNLRLIEQDKLTLFLLLYSFGVTISLLVFETLVDLENNRIFYIWFAIGLAQFLIYLLTKDNMNFKIYRSPNFETNNFINQYISDTTTTSLKTLFCFLISYKIFNSIMKKMTGNYLLNTYRQMSWSHDTIKRKISGLDVVFNILLYVVIIISALTR